MIIVVLICLVLVMCRHEGGVFKFLYSRLVSIKLKFALTNTRSYKALKKERKLQPIWSDSFPFLLFLELMFRCIWLIQILWQLCSLEISSAFYVPDHCIINSTLGKFVLKQLISTSLNYDTCSKILLRLSAGISTRYLIYCGKRLFLPFYGRLLCNLQYLLHLITWQQPLLSHLFWQGNIVYRSGAVLECVSFQPSLVSTASWSALNNIIWSVVCPIRISLRGQESINSRQTQMKLYMLSL